MSISNKGSDDDLLDDEPCGGPPWVKRCRVAAFTLRLVVFPAIYVSLVTREYNGRRTHIRLNATVAESSALVQPNCSTKEAWPAAKTHWFCVHKHLGCTPRRPIGSARSEEAPSTFNNSATSRRLGAQPATGPRPHKVQHERGNHEHPRSSSSAAGGDRASSMQLAERDIMSKLPKVGMFVHIPKVNLNLPSRPVFKHAVYVPQLTPTFGRPRDFRREAPRFAKRCHPSTKSAFPGEQPLAIPCKFSLYMLSIVTFFSGCGCGVDLCIASPTRAFGYDQCFPTTHLHTASAGRAY
jgi:hypothetical protein